MSVDPISSVRSRPSTSARPHDHLCRRRVHRPARPRRPAGLSALGRRRPTATGPTSPPHRPAPVAQADLPTRPAPAPTSPRCQAAALPITLRAAQCAMADDAPAVDPHRRPCAAWHHHPGRAGSGKSAAGTPGLAHRRRDAGAACRRPGGGRRHRDFGAAGRLPGRGAGLIRCCAAPTTPTPGPTRMTPAAFGEDFRCACCCGRPRTCACPAARRSQRVRPERASAACTPCAATWWKMPTTSYVTCRTADFDPAVRATQRPPPSPAPGCGSMQPLSDDIRHWDAAEGHN